MGCVDRSSSTSRIDEEFPQLHDRDGNPIPMSKRVCIEVFGNPENDETSKIDDGQRRCAECLLFRTPKCTYAHIPSSVFAGGFACSDFYLLDRRIKRLKKHDGGKKWFEKAVERL